jgi:hypothetical protein
MNMSCKSFCQCCGKELTEKTSRMTGMGPICRASHYTGKLASHRLMEDMFSRRHADYKKDTYKGYTVLTDLHKGGAFLHEDIDHVLSEIWQTTLPDTFKGLITLDQKGVYDGIQVTENAEFHRFISLSCARIEDAIKVAGSISWVVDSNHKSNYMALPK